MIVNLSDVTTLRMLRHVRDMRARVENVGSRCIPDFCVSMCYLSSWIKSLITEKGLTKWSCVAKLRRRVTLIGTAVVGDMSLKMIII